MKFQPFVLKHPDTPSWPYGCWFLERARSLGVEHKAPGPILLGRHLLELGVKPGPRMGEILKAVYERQLDGTVTTLEEAVAAARALL